WKKEIVFRYLTGRDEHEINAALEKTRKHSDLESIVTTRLIHSIISIDGIEERSRIAQGVRNMPASDALALREYMGDNEPRVDMVSEVPCTSCDWEGELDMPLDVSFFWPQRRR
ncbi:MAG: hypothetical protein Q7K43_05565, partial [Candidatus Woesearchaeota archaeon]|nr:hypothetical protein [Candidatus Woesearchaeota archaeon]